MQGDHLQQLGEEMARGCGLVCVHYAVEPTLENGNKEFIDWLGGCFEINYSVNPHWQANFKSLPKHPVSAGVKPFGTLDEWYYHMRFRENMEGVTPILSALPPEESLTRPDGPHSGNPEVRAAVLERKEKQHTMWAFQRPASAGGSRAFGFTGGHFHKNWQHDDHRRVVLNATAWISGLDVPKEGVPSKTPTDAEMAENLDKKR